MALVLEEKRILPVAEGATWAEAGCLGGQAEKQPSSRRGESQANLAPFPSLHGESGTRPICDPGGEGRVERLREWLSRHRQRRARRLGWTKGFVSTGLERLDAALPNGGVPNGAVAEIYSQAAGVGALTLALRIAAGSIISSSSSGAWTGFSNRQSTPARRDLRSAATMGCEKGFSHQRNRQSTIVNRQSVDSSRAIVFVDTWGDFYPPAVAAFGIDPESLIVIRNVSQRDAFWAVDQCLRCSAVAALVAPLSRLDERESRRLQLAAESSGAIGLLLRQGQPRSRTFAAVRMLVEGVPSSFSSIPRSRCRSRLGRDNPLIPSSLRRSIASSLPQSLCKITVLSVREGMPADPFVVDLNHATGACDLSSIPGDRPAAKIG